MENNSTIKQYAVRVTDSTATTHTYGYYGKGDYSWEMESLNEGAAGIVFFDTFEEAAEVANEFIKHIQENEDLLAWAWADVEEFEFEID